MLMGWRGNLCLLSISEIGYNVLKVESTSYWPWSKIHTWNVVEFIASIPQLQDYLIALMCFYWGIWSCALLRIPCSLIYPLSQLFVLFQSFFFFTLMNLSLTNRYSPHSFHVTHSIVWIVVLFMAVKTLSISALRFPSALQDRPRVPGVLPEGCSQCCPALAQLWSLWCPAWTGCWLFAA